MQKTILLVDDDEALRETFSNYLTRRGKGQFCVHTAAGARDAIALLEEERIDLVLSDLRMPDGDAIDLMAYLSAHQPDQPVIVLSGYVGPEQAEALLAYGHIACQPKPIRLSKMYEVVKEALLAQDGATEPHYFSLAGILQLVSIDEKSCLVDVRRSPNENSALFFVQGRLRGAVCGHLRDEDAMLETLTWEQPTIRVLPLSQTALAHASPDCDVSHLVAQAAGSSSTHMPEDPTGASRNAAVQGPDNRVGTPPGGARGPAVRTDRPGVSARAREILNALVVAALLMVYQLATSLLPPVEEFFGSALTRPLSALFLRGLVLWAMVLLWVAYRRWYNEEGREEGFSALLTFTGPELLMLVNARGDVVKCSDSVQRVLGYETREVLGRNIASFFEYAAGTAEEATVRKALRKFGFHRGEGLARGKRRADLQVEIITNRLRSTGDKIVLILDITDRKRYEDTLCEAKNAAERAVREREQVLEQLEASYARLKEVESLRDSLTHMVVHDMKSPLSVVESYLSLLQDQLGESASVEEALDIVGITVSQTRRLNLMVHSLLEASRLEAGKMALKTRTGSIRKAIESALTYVSTPEVTDRIRLRCDLEEEAFCFDFDLVERVMANLLTNAIKYDREGRDIAVEVEADDAWVTVAVLDRGPGIPDDCRELIFEKFGTIAKDELPKTGSSGLGLTFCRLAVEAHGGRIGVSDREGGGSRFWVTLPTQLHPPAESHSSRLPLQADEVHLP